MQFPSKMFKLFLTEFRIHVDAIRGDVQSTLVLWFADRWESVLAKLRGIKSRISNLGAQSFFHRRVKGKEAKTTSPKCF